MIRNGLTLSFYALLSLVCGAFAFACVGALAVETPPFADFADGGLTAVAAFSVFVWDALKRDRS